MNVHHLARRVFLARFRYIPDEQSPRDAARIEEIERIIEAIDRASLALVEQEDGR